MVAPVDPDVSDMTDAVGATGAENALGRALGLLGDEWTLLILQQELLGVTRFSDLRSAIGISDAVLNDRLRRLTANGLLERRIYSQTPLRAEYVLTAAGRGTWPVLLGIWDWERTWVVGRAAELPAMVHLDCGHAFSPVTTCGSCREPVTLSDIDARWGPAGGWPRSIPQARTRRRSSSARDGDSRFPETMAILGNRWSSALVAAALLGTRRFSEFEQRLAIPAALLSERLASFREADVMAVVPQAGRADRHDYVLTDKGRALLPLVLSLVAWAQEQFGQDDGVAIDLVHRPCGRALETVLACDRCDRPLTGGSIDVVGAGGPA